MLVWFLPLFLIFLLVGLPVFFSLLAAPGILLWLNGQARDAAMLYRNIYNGIDSFPLMAIPFFMLAGELMNRGGITLRLVEFSQAMMGHLRGGLAHVNILSSILFAGLSGSAVADTSAIGSMLIPAMEKQGYSKKFAAAITAASSVYWSNYTPIRNNDYLCIRYGRECRCFVFSRHCSRCVSRN